MKLLITYFMLIGLIFSGLTYRIHSLKAERATDAYLRQRVFMLKTSKGQCTGVQVKAPSGIIYMLTAGHCKDLMDAGASMEAIDENGVSTYIDLQDADKNADLLLLTAANKNVYLDIADKTYPHEKVHTMTHGEGLASFRTDGELIEEKKVDIPDYDIESKEDEAKCIAENAKVVPAGMFGGLVCVKVWPEMITTALVAPGSSGGPMVDSDGKLVGIVSITHDIFSGVMPLHLIQDFLRDK